MKGASACSASQSDLCDGCAVVFMRLSHAGLPLAILSNSTAYALHLGMKSWMCVADSSFSLSSYASIMTSHSPTAGALGQHWAVQHSAAYGACTLTWSFRTWLDRLTKECA